MSALQVTAPLTIHDVSGFETVAAQCMQSLRDKDTGTLQYDRFPNDAGTECVVRVRGGH